MELFRVVEGNQPQALPAAGHQQAFARQQVALGAAVRTGKAAVAVFRIGDNFQMAVSPPAENEYAVEPVGVARIMPSLR